MKRPLTLVLEHKYCCRRYQQQKHIWLKTDTTYNTEYCLINLRGISEETLDIRNGGAVEFIFEKVNKKQDIKKLSSVLELMTNSITAAEGPRV